MTRKKGWVPIIPCEDLPRDQGEWDPGPLGEADQISLAQANTPERVTEFLALAGHYCRQADLWAGRNEGVAKACLRDAIVCLSRLWLGKPLSEVRALIAQFLAGEQASPATGRGAKRGRKGKEGAG
jgi:hypothetical protein